MPDAFGGIEVDEAPSGVDKFGGVLVEEPTPLEPPKGVVPAVRMIGGEVVPGKPLDTHPDIIKREGLSALDIDQRGFTAPGVPFMDRETAATATGLPTLFEPGRLHSTDLIKAQQGGDLSAFQPPEPVPVKPPSEELGGPANMLGVVGEVAALPFRAAVDLAGKALNPLLRRKEPYFGESQEEFLARRDPIQYGKSLFPHKETALDPEGSDAARMLERWTTPEGILMIPAGMTQVGALAVMSQMAPGVVQQISDTAKGGGSEIEKRDKINDLFALGALVTTGRAGKEIARTAKAEPSEVVPAEATKATTEPGALEGRTEPPSVPPLLEGDHLVTIERTAPDGTSSRYLASYNPEKFYDLTQIGGGKVPQIGKPTKTSWSHGLLDKNEKIIEDGGQSVLEGRTGFTGTPIASEEIWKGLEERHGIKKGGVVDVISDPKDTASGRILFDQDRKPTGIQINQAKISSPAQLDWVVQHEASHWYDLENPDMAGKLQTQLTSGEWESIFNKVVKLGYKENVIADEITARGIQELALQWRQRGWFGKLTSQIMRFASEKLGIKMNRAAAENAAVRAIAQSIKRIGEVGKEEQTSSTMAGIVEGKPVDWELFSEQLQDDLDSFSPARESGKVNYELNDMAQRFVDYAKSDTSGKPLSRLVADFSKTDEASPSQIRKLRESVKSVESQSLEAKAEEPPLVGMGGAREGEPAPGAQIEQLTQALKNVREKKAPIGEQVKESFGLGKKYAAVKDAIGQALAGMKTAGDTLISKWQGVEKIDDLLRAKGVLSRDIEARGWRLRQWEKEAYKAIPNPRDQAAIAKWVDAGGDINELQNGLNNAPAKYKRAYADAMELKGDKLVAAQNVQNYFEARLQEAIDAGVLDHGVENYLHRMYESKPDLLKRALSYTQTGLLKVNPSLAKKRVFQFDWEAEKLGYTPVQSFIKRITAYEASLSKAIAAREFIKKTTEMKAADGRPVVDIKGVGIPVEDASGMREATLIKPKFNASKNSQEFLPNGDPNPNYRGDYVTRDYRALSRWKWASNDAEGKPIFVQGDVAIHPDYVTKIDALLQPSQVRYGKYGKYLRPALGASSVMKQTMLDLSGFHQVQITVHGMEHKVLPWKIIKDIDLSDPNVDGLLKGGVTLGGDYSGAYKEGLVGNSLTRLVPGLGDVIESYHQWLFQDYIPRIKMTMALNALERNRARFGGKMTEEQIFQKTANQANAAFGELNYITLERSKTARDISRLILLAPDFLEARGRFAAQAFERGGKGVPGIGGNEQRMALLLGALTMYFTARIANKIIDGQYHDEPENLFNVVYDGHTYGLRTVQGDLLHLLTKPLQFWTSRLNPVYGRTLLEALTGRDYFGRKRSPAEQAWDAVSTIVPISLRSSRERKLWESLLNGFGVTSRRWSDVDDAFTLAKKWKDTHGVGERGEFIYDPQKDALRPLKLALNHGDEVGAAKEIKALLDSKAYTLKRLDTYFNRYAAMPFTGSRANDKKFMATLNEDQKKTVEAAKQHKIEIRKLYQKSKGQYLARPVAADSVTRDQFGGVPLE